MKYLVKAGGVIKGKFEDEDKAIADMVRQAEAIRTRSKKYVLTNRGRRCVRVCHVEFGTHFDIRVVEAE